MAKAFEIALNYIKSWINNINGYICPGLFPAAADTNENLSALPHWEKMQKLFLKTCFCSGQIDLDITYAFACNIIQLLL